MDKKFEDKEGDVYEPLLKQEDKKMMYSIDEIDDDEDDTKCFAFTTEIKITLKYILKECPKLF